MHEFYTSFYTIYNKSSDPPVEVENKKVKKSRFS